MESKIILITLLFLTNIEILLAQPKQNTSDRQNVDLTIYNSNFVLIREERKINLSNGLNKIVIPDVPATIIGTSLHFNSLTNPSSVKVIEQNYQYDLVNTNKLLEKYVGKEVEFRRTKPEDKKEYIVSGKLLSSGWGNDNIIAEINGKIEINPVGNMILPYLPEGLILKPQLEWLINSSDNKEHRVEISYIANSMNWNCEYVAILNEDDTKVSLIGWVTITNFTGTTFKNAGIKLVAGDVNTIEESEFTLKDKRYSRAISEERVPQFQQTEIFEYKLYSLQRKTDVLSNETKQIELISAQSIKCKKIFVYDGISDNWRYWFANNYSYRDQSSMGQQSNNKVGVYIKFNNDEKSGLGMALPKGRIRVYKKDQDKKEQFVGEDLIDHTPKDEEIKLYLGNAFDIKGERIQKEFKCIESGHIYEESFEIKIRNHKNDSVEVMVYEHPWRWNEWEIRKSNTQWEKIDQQTIKFPISLKKDEEKIITYTIRYKW
ncbi:MAG: DUF4139 domain-containing protein [Chitinispirillaceae bacterium]|nr:DUF4139 domain-containing protein [Chitinispirillaceae bacterium]